MIYSITFNPALDVSGTVDSLIPNEKSYVYDELYTPGGNGVNAGIIAHRLGAEIALSGFLGGANGKVISSLLDKEKIEHHFIETKTNTRINLTISNKKDHKQTRLSFPGAHVTNAEWKKLVTYLNQVTNKDIVIIGGSLPSGVSTEKISALIRQLIKKKIFCMVDSPSRALQELIPAKPSFIKPNLKEFQELTKSRGSSIHAVLKEIKKLHKDVPLICVSSVEGGAILANEHEAWFGTTPHLSIRSTVGAGDSMVGAMAYLLAINPKSSLDELLKIGLAASSATLSNRGMTLGSRKEIRKFLSRIKVRNLYR